MGGRGEGSSGHEACVRGGVDRARGLMSMRDVAPGASAGVLACLQSRFVRENRGTVVSNARVTLALVDEAILAMTSYKVG